MIMQRNWKKMTHWNYRIIEHHDKKGNLYYGVHEIYYADKKEQKIEGYTTHSVVSYEDDINKLFMSVKNIYKAKNKPIISINTLKELK